MTEMKKTFKYFAIAAAFTAVACAQEIDSPEEGLVADTFTATIESKDTKTSIGNDNYTVWTEGDAVTVFTEKSDVHQYILAEGKNTNAGTFAASSTVAQTKVAAIYPHNEANAYDGEKFTVQVPSQHTYVAGEISKAPMVGVFADGKVTFKNAGALIRVTATNIPAGFHTVTLTSEDVNLSGEMTVEENNLTAGTFAEAQNIVSITWTPENKKTDKEFYFPIPVATFSKLTVTATDGNQTYTIKEKANFTSERNTRYNMSYDADVFEIKDEDGLFWLAEEVAGGRTFDGQTVKLTADIEMTRDWTPIGNEDDGINKSFRGTFDGQNHTISGLNVTAVEGAGFFGFKWDGDVLNVKFDKAKVSGNHYGGVVVGWTDGANYNYKFKIDCCEVTNSTVTLAAEETDKGWDNGDKAGAIVGYAYSIIVSNNKVSNTSVTGYRDLGGIAGCAINNTSKTDYTEITGNTIGENVTITVDNSHNYNKYTSASLYNVANYCGRVENKGGTANVIEDNTGDATINTPQTTELSFDKEVLIVIMGDDFTAPKLTPEGEGVTYSSSDDNVAIVDEVTGELELKTAGTTTITATLSETSTHFAASASYILTVKPERSARNLYFQNNQVTAALGDESFVSQTVLGTSEGVTYASSNTAVATVDATTGAVTLKAAGTTTITASAPQTDELLADEASYKLTVYKKSDFGVIGVNSDWENDIIMYETDQDNFFVAFGVNFASEGAFKIRKNKVWNDNYNFGTTSTTVRQADSVVGVYTDGGSKDINVKSGTYDIYFDRLAGQVYIMSSGKSHKDAKQPTTTEYYSLAGSFTEGGWDDTVPMKYSGDGIWTNVQTFKANDEFKVKNKGSWTSSWGYDNVFPGQNMVSNKDGNAKVKTGGTYIVGFYKGGDKITLVNK